MEILQTNLSEMEKIKSESDSHVRDMKKLFKEKDQLTEKLFETKEELHNMQNMLTQSETTIKTQERNALKLEDKLKETKESERIALNQLEVMKKTQIEMNEEMIDKIKYLELQRDMLKLEGDLSALKLVLREKEDEIQSLKNEFARKESNTKEEFASKLEMVDSAHEQEVNRMKVREAQLETEISGLNQIKDDLSKNSSRELQLMSMILHGVGLEIMRTNRSKKTKSK